MSFSNIFDRGVPKLLATVKELSHYTTEQKNKHKKKILGLPLEEILSCLEEYLMGLPDPTSSLPITISERILIINSRDILSGVSVIFDVEIKSSFQACKRNLSKKEKQLKFRNLNTSEILKLPKRTVKAKITLDEPIFPAEGEVLSFHSLHERQASPKDDKAVPEGEVPRPSVARDVSVPEMDELRAEGWPVLEDFVTPTLESTRIPRQTLQATLPQELPPGQDGSPFMERPIEKVTHDLTVPEMVMPKPREICDVATDEVIDAALAEADILGPEKRPRAQRKPRHPLLYHAQPHMSNEEYKDFLNQKMMEAFEAFENADHYIEKKYSYLKKKEEEEQYFRYYDGIEGPEFDFLNPHDFLYEKRMPSDEKHKEEIRGRKTMTEMEITGRQPSLGEIGVCDSLLDMFGFEEISRDEERRGLPSEGLAMTLPSSPPIPSGPPLSISLPQPPTVPSSGASSLPRMQRSLRATPATSPPQRELADVSTLSTPHLQKGLFLQQSEEIVLNLLKGLCTTEGDFTTTFTALCPLSEQQFVAAVFFKQLITLWGRNQVDLRQTSSHPSDIHIRLEPTML